MVGREDGLGRGVDFLAAGGILRQMFSLFLVAGDHGWLEQGARTCLVLLRTTTHFWGAYYLELGWCTFFQECNG